MSGTPGHVNGGKSDEFQVENQGPAMTPQQPETKAYVPRTMPAPGSALAIGAFTTTLTTLSLSLMGWRGVTITNIYIGNFFFLGCIAMLVTAQWEIAAGNGFTYTVFSAFGLFWGGYGAILTPAFGILDAYADEPAQLNNALGYFTIVWSIFVLIFFIAALPTNLTYLITFAFVFLAFLFLAAGYFAAADGLVGASANLHTTAGVFCFIAGLSGWYLTLYLMIKDSICELPLGDTSGYFRKILKKD